MVRGRARFSVQSCKPVQQKGEGKPEKMLPAQPAKRISTSVFHFDSGFKENRLRVKSRARKCADAASMFAQPRSNSRSRDHIALEGETRLSRADPSLRCKCTNVEKRLRRRAISMAYLYGMANLAQHYGSEAAAGFQNVLVHPGIVFTDPSGALARLQIARAYALA
jgi:hypothetical protein